MSAAEIIAEPPKLTEAERRSVRPKPMELAVQTKVAARCDQTAFERAMMLAPSA